MIVRFSPAAAQDLEEIGDYLNARNPSAAYRFVRDLRGRCGKLADMPLRGVARPEFGETMRSFAFRRMLSSIRYRSRTSVSSASFTVRAMFGPFWTSDARRLTPVSAGCGWHWGGAG
jgi:plasmid stabilization system protein ParE